MFKVFKEHQKSIFSFPAMEYVMAQGIFRVKDWNDLFPSLMAGIGVICIVMLLPSFITEFAPKSSLPTSVNFGIYAIHIVSFFILMGVTISVSYGFAATYFGHQIVHWNLLILLSVIRSLILAPFVAIWGWSVHSRIKGCIQ